MTRTTLLRLLGLVLLIACVAALLPAIAMWSPFQQLPADPALPNQARDLTIALALCFPLPAVILLTLGLRLLVTRPTGPRPRLLTAHGVAAALALCVPLAAMYVLVPRFQELFNDVGVMLASMTIWFIQASAWMAGNMPDQAIPGIVLIGPVVVLVAIATIAATAWPAPASSRS